MARVHFFGEVHALKIAPITQALSVMERIGIDPRETPALEASHSFDHCYWHCFTSHFRGVEVLSKC